MKKKGKYLGEILKSKGLITDDQLQAVIKEQLRNKKFIGEMFVEKGLITEKDLLETLADQFGIDHVNLKDQEIDWTVSTGFSSSLITDHKCLPLWADEETVTIAITNPLDVWILEAAEKEASPRRVKVVLVTPSDMDEVIKEYRRQSIRKMMNKWRKE